MQHSKVILSEYSMPKNKLCYKGALMKFFTPCLFLAFVFNTLHAQRKTDSLLKGLTTQKEDTNKVNIMLKLAIALNNSRSYDSSLNYCSEAQLLAAKIGYSKGEAKAMIWRGSSLCEMDQYDSALVYESKALAISNQIKNKELLSNAFIYLGNIYYQQGNYVKALENYSNSLSKSQECGSNYIEASCLCNIGNIYKTLGDYPKSLDFYLKALAIEEKIKKTWNISAVLHNLGTIYEAMENYSTAQEYYTQSLNIAKEHSYKELVIYNLNNMGHLYCNAKNYAMALDYESKSLELGQEIHSQKEIAYAYETIGDIYEGYESNPHPMLQNERRLDVSATVANFSGNNYANAVQYYNMAMNIYKNTGNKSEVPFLYVRIGQLLTEKKEFREAKSYLDSALTLSKMMRIRKNISDIYACFMNLDSATRNYKKYGEDIKEYYLYHDSIENDVSISKVTHIEMEYEFEKKQDSISAVQEKLDIIQRDREKTKDIMFYSAILIGTLVMFLSAVLINRQKLKNKNIEILFEKERQKIEGELSHAKNLLDEYIKTMEQKNDILERFKNENEEFKKRHLSEVEQENEAKRIEHLELLSRTTILTDDDWDKFQRLFGQVYKGFFIQLKEKFPNLTQAEIRLYCLTKLGLRTKQMQGLLGISFNTIKTIRHNLRKKLGISENENLHDFTNKV